MLVMKWLSSCVVAIGMIVSASAQDGKPRVLILGDSVTRQFAQTAAKELTKHAEIVIPKTDPGDTGTGLGRLDDLLGTGKWDLIHFNFGFADLRYRDPATKSIRAMSKHAGGIRASTPQQYEKNLREIVARLKATGAKLVWASSTPIGASKYDNLYDPGSEIDYNAIAAKIMAEHKVPINDLNAWVLANVKKRTDPFSFRNVPIHQPVVASIVKELGLPEK
ncbi:MAG: lysophospholipase L1-like esterase [Verrucomicrobiales bacterium]|jgi:lysophospholipase L1-like esterase